MDKVLTHSTKSYIKIFLVGTLVGGICRLADYFPADTLWSFSSIQTLLGFWIITNTIIVLLSASNICAGISSFLYIVKAKLFCPEIAGLFCRIAGLFCHDSRANLSLKPVCFGIAIS